MQVAPPEDQRPSKNKGGGSIKRRITQACILCRKKKVKPILYCFSTLVI